MKMVVEVPTFAEKLLLRVAKRGGKTPQEWVREAILGLLSSGEEMSPVIVSETSFRRAWENAEDGVYDQL
ncbi:MAG: hypothetical protein AAF471_05385 [Myxococcota bacterium]